MHCTLGILFVIVIKKIGQSRYLTMWLVPCRDWWPAHRSKFSTRSATFRELAMQHTVRVDGYFFRPSNFNKCTPPTGLVHLLELLICSSFHCEWNLAVASECFKCRKRAGTMACVLWGRNADNYRYVCWLLCTRDLLHIVFCLPVSSSGAAFSVHSVWLAFVCAWTTVPNFGKRNEIWIGQCKN